MKHIVEEADDESMMVELDKLTVFSFFEYVRSWDGLPTLEGGEHRRCSASAIALY